MDWLIVSVIIGMLYPPLAIVVMVLAIPAVVIMGLVSLADRSSGWEYGTGRPSPAQRNLRKDPVFLVVAGLGALLILFVIYIVIHHG